MSGRTIDLKSLRKGFTLIEIMIVVAIIGILVSIAGYTWFAQRTRSQQRVCQENLVKIDNAKEQWAMENNKTSIATPIWKDLVELDGSGYLKKQPACPASGVYTLNQVGQRPSCTIIEPVDHNAEPGHVSP